MSENTSEMQRFSEALAKESREYDEYARNLVRAAGGDDTDVSTSYGERSSILNVIAGLASAAAKPASPAPDPAARIRQLEEENLKLGNALMWACGYVGKFRQRKVNEGEFYWRRELMERAGLSAGGAKDKE